MNFVDLKIIETLRAKEKTLLHFLCRLLLNVPVNLVSFVWFLLKLLYVLISSDFESDNVKK